MLAVHALWSLSQGDAGAVHLWAEDASLVAGPGAAPAAPSSGTWPPHPFATAPARPLNPAVPSSIGGPEPDTDAGGIGKVPVIALSFTYYAFSYSSPVNAQTSIYLMDTPRWPIRPIAVLSFYSGDVPPNSVEPSGAPVLCFPRGAFRDIIDFLRNERPLELIWDTDNLIGSIQSAAAEPVGEEES